MALAIRFVDCINLGDLAGLTELMTPAHRLEVFQVAPADHSPFGLGAVAL